MNKTEPKHLRQQFVIIAELYADILCEKMNCSRDRCWWVGDYTTLIMEDFSLSFEDVRLLVDNGVSRQELNEFWNDVVLSEYSSAVNLQSFLKGFRWNQ